MLRMAKSRRPYVGIVDKMLQACEGTYVTISCEVNIFLAISCIKM